MTHPWPDLKWWNSGERQAAEEKYDDLVKAGVDVYPRRRSLYAALSRTSLAETRAIIIGQDPYPGRAKDGTPYATGVAFECPRSVPRTDFPSTLRIIFNEYCSDLGLEAPSSGDLSHWTKQGVLLWNSIPCVQSGHPLSCDWIEWRSLTAEIVDRLNERGGVVFVCLGAVARSFVEEVDRERNRIIVTSHPSPRGIRSSKSPFTGSRAFSTCNARLVELGQTPINWRLDDVDSTSTSNGIPSVVGGGNVLPNITGADLGGLKKQGTSPNIYTSLVF